MSPKRLKKIALYLEYIAFFMRSEAEVMERVKRGVVEVISQHRFKMQVLERPLRRAPVQLRLV